jgi:hypothetical protein
MIGGTRGVFLGRDATSPSSDRLVEAARADYRLFSHTVSDEQSYASDLAARSQFRAGVCGHDANHTAECATQGHNLRTLDRTRDAEASNVAP